MIFGRLGLIGRLTGIVFLLLLAVIGINLAVLVLTRDKATGPVEDRFPLPDQAVSIVELLEERKPDEWDRVLRAVRTPEFQVRIVEEVPGDLLRHSRVPGLEWLIASYLHELGERDVLAVRMARPDEGFVANMISRLAPWGQTTVNLAIEMRNGRFAVFEVGSASPQRLFGIPVGLWLGILGSLFFALALWAITREARPLRAMTQALDRFSDDGVPRPTTPTGAPEIKRLIDATNQMQHRISELIKGRAILLGAISHDLRTFLTRLRMRVETLPVADQRQKAINEIEQMTYLLDDAISVSRGAFRERDHVLIDLADLVKLEIDRRAPSPVHLSPLSGTQVPHITGDAISLTRLLANLIDNGLRYGTTVHVSLSARSGHVVLEVRDDGPGIPEGERENIFEPFYRLDRARSSATGGSGLGLAIVRQIVEAHGGTVTVDTAAGGGAHFQVVLPCAA